MPYVPPGWVDYPGIGPVSAQYAAMLDQIKAQSANTGVRAPIPAPAPAPPPKLTPAPAPAPAPAPSQNTTPSSASSSSPSPVSISGWPYGVPIPPSVLQQLQPTPAPPPTPPPSPGNVATPIINPPTSTLQNTLINPPGLGGTPVPSPIVAGSSSNQPSPPKLPSVGSGSPSGSTAPVKGGPSGGPSAAESGTTSTGSNQPAPNAPGPASVTPPTGLSKETAPTTGPGSPWATWGQRAGGLGNAPGATGTAKSKLGSTILTGGTPYMPGNTQAGVNQSIGTYQDMQKKYSKSYSDMLESLANTSAGIPSGVPKSVPTQA